jgi:hypothetical protein
LGTENSDKSFSILNDLVSFNVCQYDAFRKLYRQGTSLSKYNYRHNPHANEKASKKDEHKIIRGKEPHIMEYNDPRLHIIPVLGGTSKLNAHFFFGFWEFDYIAG